MYGWICDVRLWRFWVRGPGGFSFCPLLLSCVVTAEWAIFSPDRFYPRASSWYSNPNPIQLHQALLRPTKMSHYPKNNGDWSTSSAITILILTCCRMKILFHRDFMLRYSIAGSLIVLSRFSIEPTVSKTYGNTIKKHRFNILCPH